jgi:tRNA modification GTPase
LVSAKTGMGREYLIQAINRLVFTRDSGEARLALNQRHVQAIELALDHVQQAASMAESAAIELLALELRTALNHLGGILGMVSPDDLLGEIFSRFCIGK